MPRPWWHFREGSFVPPPQAVGEDQGSHSPGDFQASVTSPGTSCLGNEHWASSRIGRIPILPELYVFELRYLILLTIKHRCVAVERVPQFSKVWLHFPGKCLGQNMQNMQHALLGTTVSCTLTSDTLLQTQMTAWKCYNEVRLCEATLRTITQRRLLGKQISTRLSETSKRLPCEHTINWF